ncbi:MAG TPA: O-acetyl-ADP-ribose deacetylase [Spirochaetia bacterium]|nr:O-acetyl-ADP-ribose deacetylase [Spirochaetia bacterium]
MEGVLLLGGRVRVLTGDITLMEVDAVVNAANSSLMGGGGVDGAIHRRGCPSILEECRRIRETLYPDGLPTGKAVLTSGGNLHAQWVIHTVGPVWQGGHRGEDAALRDAYLNSLKLAADTGCATVAFPAISTGVYGFPKERASRIVFDTLKEFTASHSMPQRIDLVFFDEKDAEIFLHAIGRGVS